jgi:hypothetical protein
MVQPPPELSPLHTVTAAEPEAVKTATLVAAMICAPAALGAV